MKLRPHERAHLNTRSRRFVGVHSGTRTLTESSAQTYLASDAYGGWHALSASEGRAGCARAARPSLRSERATRRQVIARNNQSQGRVGLFRYRAGTRGGTVFAISSVAYPTEQRSHVGRS